jgi:hypothetical protein
LRKNEREKMKNIFLVLSVAGVVALACYTLTEGMKRQAVVDCWAAKKICTQFYDVHGGDCLECRTMEQCEIDGLFNE